MLNINFNNLNNKFKKVLCFENKINKVNKRLMLFHLARK